MQRLTIDKVRPRRTSEFHDEQGTATKRQTRAGRRCASIESTPLAAGTTQKGGQRPRISATGGSATRGRLVDPTPQKTPNNSARVLFTAEKCNGIARHSDKKWVQEQTQRITEYLKKSWYPGGMTGINEDFFTRPNCLKQMSIKQFVGIINYFLHFIWANKFTVGSNHVEDIVKILQKLNYPHQVNKSWLKTPNTTYSFGNVIVLLDFLMDFVPNTSLEFPLLEPQEETSDAAQVGPDVEYKANLLKNCEEGFSVWDKKLEDEEKKLKLQTANMLVQKCCGAADIHALDIEIDRLLKNLETIQNECPVISIEDEEECKRLKKAHHTIRKNIERLCEQYKKCELQMVEMMEKKEYLNSEIAQMQNKNTAHEMAIRKQMYSVKERDDLIDKIQELRTETQCYERTINDLENRDCRQQVQLSNAKKQLTDTIEKLNTILRSITFMLSITDPQWQLQVPLNPDPSFIERLLPQFNIIKNKILNEIEKNTELIKPYEIQNEKLRHAIFVVNESRRNALDLMEKSIRKKQEELEEQTKKEFESLVVQEQNLDLELGHIDIEIENVKQRLQDVKNECQRLEAECEEIMSKGEKEHSESVERRTKILDEFEEGLNLFGQRLEEVKMIVEKENNPNKPYEEK